jgi:hypothetical protein
MNSLPSVPAFVFAGPVRSLPVLNTANNKLIQVKSKILTEKSYFLCLTHTFAGNFLNAG